MGCRGAVLRGEGGEGGRGDGAEMAIASAGWPCFSVRLL